MNTQISNSQTKLLMLTPEQAIERSIKLLKTYDENKEITFFGTMGSKIPLKNVVNELAKIQTIWEHQRLSLKTLEAYPWKKKSQFWNGIDIPENIRQRIQYTPLNKKYYFGPIHALCIYGQESLDLQRNKINKLLKWFMASGFSANEYNGLVTPVGLAAYTGQLDLVQTMYAGGADLKLEIQPGHTNDVTQIGSTLLHRMAERYNDNFRKIEVAKFLINIYDDPMALDGKGCTPLDYAQDAMLDGLQEVLALRQKKELNGEIGKIRQIKRSKHL